MNLCPSIRDTKIRKVNALIHFCGGTWILHKLVYICTVEITFGNYNCYNFLQFLIRVLPDDYAGGPLLWLPQFEPAGGFSPVKKTVGVGKTCTQ